MQKRVVLVRHGDDPPDDRVITWLTGAGYQIDLRKPFAGDVLGDVDDTVAGTVIYGGKYNADDASNHPFLDEEYRWIAACLAADVPILGLCQGAQQIAYHLGAWAGPRADEVHEFGYYRVDPTPQAGNFLSQPLWFTQMHFHTFDLPEGAVRLAGSAQFENQAFRYGDKVYGLQFHPEVTIEGFRRWQKLRQGDYGLAGMQTQDEQTQLMHVHDAEQAAWFYGFMDRFLGPAG